MKLINADDLYKTIKQTIEDSRSSSLYFLIGFISGFINDSPKYDIPDEIAEQYKSK